MTDDRRTPDPMADIGRLPRGAVVIFRHYDAPDRAGLGRRLRERAMRLGLVFVVAGDWRLARRLGADGLHLPAWMVRRPARFAPRWRGLLTAAAHGFAAARAADRAGADLVLLSPVFPTASHPDRPALGVISFARTAGRLECGVLALGGVTPERLRRVVMTGAAGYAGISAVRPAGRRRGL
ncbi:MAG: thiamine phosphate synthase [Rhodospirillaceae bacterium]